MAGDVYPRTLDRAEPVEALAQPVDLRSDTVTRPTPEMRRAMAEADVGDDVYGEDPTVNRLEAHAAELFEREAALLVPTGSMGNLLALWVHCQAGQEVLCEARSYVYTFQGKAARAIAGCQVRTLDTKDGVLAWRHLAPALRDRSGASVGLIVLENTHNVAGGIVTPTEVQEEICDRVHERGIPVHLDGARIFNAAVALGRPVADVARKVDSIMFCLSKGLGAPVGSMLVGSKPFIEKARNYRRKLGGGMRQAGVLAAAGLVALEKSPALLARDHALARQLAEGLAGIPGLGIDPARVQTNILVFDVSGTKRTSEEIVAALKTEGVLALALDRRTIRMVTHCDVDAAGIEHAVRALRRVLAG